ncbi:MAG: AI-2E family transporter [Acidiferrobacterales bacterium]
MTGFADQPAIKAGLVFLLIALPIVFLAWLLKTVMLPIVIASVLYVLLEPVVNWLQRSGVNIVVAIAIVLILLVGVVTIFVGYSVPGIAEQFGEFRARLPQAWENVSQLSIKLEAWLREDLGITLESGSLVPSISAMVRQWSVKLIRGGSGVLADVVLWLILIPLITFFFLRDFRSLRNQVISFAPNRLFEKTLTIYHRVSDQLERYVRGVMLQSLIMAIVTSIGFAIVGLPMAIALGILAGIFNLIPYVGPLIALIAPLLVALSISIDPQLLLATVAVIIVGQLIDNLVVVPTVLARAANLHPLIALLAIIVAGNLFGLMGMVFALPVLASARIIYVGVLLELRRVPQRGV